MNDDPASSPDPAASTTRILGRKAGALFDLGLGTPGAEAAEKQSEPESIAPGQMLGKYRIVKKLGEGGFGAVWQAEQMGLAKMVAVKLIKPGMDSRQVIARFEAERQALSLMSHPNIAAVLDAGTTPHGHPYFVMEMVFGVSITKYCDKNKLTITDRLKLFQNVCLAMHHAHQKAILHRDIKPSNILVEEVDGEPVPKIIDFGIAKALGQSNLVSDGSGGFASCGPTGYGAFLGTPPYMSPEQANSGFDVDTRSDIYSLGAVLYELLTGQTHIPIERFKNASVPQMISLILDTEPPRPSHLFVEKGDSERLTKWADARAGNLQTLTQTLRGDLDWIVLKAIEKDRTRRYESAAALADDVERHLLDQPVVARPPSRIYVLQKMIRRNRAAVFAAALAVLALIAGSTAAVVGLLQARAALKRSVESEKQAVNSEKLAKAEAEKNQQTLDFMKSLFEDFDKGTISASTFRELLLSMDDRRREKLSGQPEADMQISRILARGFAGLDDLADAEEQYLNVRKRLRELGRTRGEEEADCLFQIAWIGDRRASTATDGATLPRDLEMLAESVEVRKSLPAKAGAELAAQRDELIKSEALMAALLRRSGDLTGAKTRLAPFLAGRGSEQARESTCYDWVLRESALVAQAEKRWGDAENYLAEAEKFHVYADSLRTQQRMEADSFRLSADLLLARGDLAGAVEVINKEKAKRSEWLERDDPGTLLRLADVQWRLHEGGGARDTLLKVGLIEDRLRRLIPEGELALRKLVEIERETIALNDTIRVENVSKLADRLRKNADRLRVEAQKRLLVKVEQAPANVQETLSRADKMRAEAEALLAPHLKEPFDEKNMEFGVRNILAAIAATKQDYKEAVAQLEKTLELMPEEFENRFRMAAFLAASGDKARFEASRRLQIAQISSAGATASATGARNAARVFSRLIWLWRTVLLTPGVSATEISRISDTLLLPMQDLENDQYSVEKELEHWRALLTGWARYRVGEYSEVDNFLGDAPKSSNKIVVVQSQLLSAMSALKQGDREKAHELLTEAEATYNLHIKPYEHTDSEVRLHDTLAVNLLLAEAQALIEAVAKGGAP